MEGIVSDIDRHLARCEAEVKELNALISALLKEKYRVMGIDGQKVVCPIGRDSCIACDAATPKVCGGQSVDNPLRFVLPGRVSTDIAGLNDTPRTCALWQRKIDVGACGCGGYHSCECGAEVHYCFSNTHMTCKYCGREMTDHPSPRPWGVRMHANPNEPAVKD